MIRILIYDKEHFETIESLLLLFNAGNNEIHVFTRQDFQDAFADWGSTSPPLQWIYNNSTENDAWFLYRYCKRKKIDTVILNTVSRHHLFFALATGLLKARLILTIHDVNGSFKPHPGIGIRAIARNLGKRWLSQNANAFIVYLQSMKAYMHSVLKIRKQVIVLPAALPKTYEQAVNQVVHICVPGSIDENRRDYKEVISLLESIKDMDVQLTLLGGSNTGYAADMVNKITKAAGSLKIKSYDQPFVDQTTFDEELMKADLIYAPLQPSITIDGTKEVYGLTKSSGVFFDAIKYGKPLLLPVHIHLPDELKDQSIIYKNVAELAAIIRKLARDTTALAALKNKAHNNSLMFSVEEIRADLHQEALMKF